MNQIKYHQDDLSYDLESLPNIFTAACYYPAPEANHFDIYYIYDDGHFDSQLQADIKHKIYQVIPALKQNHTKINLYDMHVNLENAPNETTLINGGKIPTNYNNIIRFAKIFGITALSNDLLPNGDTNHNEHNYPRIYVDSQDPTKIDPQKAFNGYHLTNQGSNHIIMQTPQRMNLDQASLTWCENVIFHLAWHTYIQNRQETNYRQQLACFIKAPNFKITESHYTPAPWWMPINKTDTGLYDPNRFGQGLRIGYNSHNYDESLLAIIFANVNFAFLDYAFLYPFKCHQLNHPLQTKLKQKQQIIIKALLEPHNQDEIDPIIPNANQIYTYNNLLFQSETEDDVTMNQLWRKLSRQRDNNAQQEIYQRATNIARAWNYTNRFIDVTQLNEKQKLVSLKRLSGVQGYLIKESDKLGSNSTHIKPDDIPDLIAYNCNDVVNHTKLYELKNYQESLDLRNNLMQIYPQLQYQRDYHCTTQPTEGHYNEYLKQAYPARPDNIDAKRINSDSTSAKVIAKVIKPDGQLSDCQQIDLHYPAKRISKAIYHDEQHHYTKFNQNLQDTIHAVTYQPYKTQHTEADSKTALAESYQHNEEFQYDVLEQTRNWFAYQIRFYAYPEAQKRIKQHQAPPELTIEKVKTNWKAAWDEFENIYNFYRELTHENVNDDLKTDDIEESSTEIINRLMETYSASSPSHNGLNYCYRDIYGRETSCYANFSVGGIHGAEYNQVLYQHDLQIYKQNRQAWETKYPAQVQTTFAQIQNEYLTSELHHQYLSQRNASDQQKLYDDIYQQYQSKYHTDDQTLTFVLNCFFTKRHNLRKHYLKKLQGEPVKPELFKTTTKNRQKSQVRKLNKKYTFTSTGVAYHEDFSSYYPTLITRLAIFYDQSTHHDIYNDLYQDRLQYKAKMKQQPFGSPAYLEANRQQKSRKLMLNAASGAGDLKYYSPIRVNNKMVSMRLIGQLFAWRIGEAEALAGARVVSTNTDGLYTAPNPKFPEFNEERNNQVLADTIKPMLIGVDPEKVDNFISKDSNNRLEIQHHEIHGAAGGTVSAYDGPSVMQSLSHAALTDCLVAHYLAAKPTNGQSQVDHPVDLTELKAKFQLKIQEIQTMPTAEKTQAQLQVLRFSQWILQANPNKQRYFALKDPNLYHVLSKTNRIFLIKHPSTKYQYLTGKPIMVTSGVPKQLKNADNQTRMQAHDDELQAYTLLMENSSPEEQIIIARTIRNPHDRDQYGNLINDQQVYTPNKAAKFNKVTGMPDDQIVELHNEELDQIVAQPNQLQDLIQRLDFDAYFELAQQTITENWLNPTIDA